jgi:hypothetical protein
VEEGDTGDIEGEDFVEALEDVGEAEASKT